MLAKFTIDKKGQIVELDTPPTPKSKSKPKTTGFADAATRDLYFKHFVAEFTTVMGYKYAGDRYKDCSSIYAFINNTQYDADFFKEMITFVLKDHNGYWGGKPVSINLLCYGRTHYDIIDAVQKKKKQQKFDAPELGNFLEGLI